MDYLLSGPGNGDNLSLQDMIECDIKTEFEEHFANEEPFKIISTGSNSCYSEFANIMSEFTDETDLFHQDEPVGCNLERETFPSSNVPNSKPTSNTFWLQVATNLSLSKDVLQNETTDGEVLMVNPQTGLPIQDQIQVQSSSPVSQQHEQVQFVTNLVNGSSIQQICPRPATADEDTTTVPVVHPIQNAHLITQALTARNCTMPFPQHNTASKLSQQGTCLNNQIKSNKIESNRIFPKPVYSYSCLIAMALKNSDTGALPVSEIYNFMTENFPYFHTAPDGWKNSVRHNLSLNKCFEKIENPKATGNTRKGCLWGLNPGKIEKMDEEIAKWRKKDLDAIQRSMAKPDILEILEKGKIGSHSPHHPNNVRTAQQSSQPKPIVPAISTTSVGQGLVTSVPAVSTPESRGIPAKSSSDVQLSMIEIKPLESNVLQTPVSIKLEPVVIKSDLLDPSGAVGGPLMSEDLNLIETSLSLDPSLMSDYSSQNGLWDELGADGGISLDDIMISSLGQGLPSSSPLTIQSSKPGLSSASATSPLVSLLTSNSSDNAKGAAASHSVTPAGGITISRTIFAQM